MPGQITAYFDTNTYKYMGGNAATLDKDGKELTINKMFYSTEETLPAGSLIKWDLSDVKGINIIDDPDGVHRDSGARG